MATRVLGDGCQYCNPSLAAELAAPLMRDALKGARDTLQALAVDWMVASDSPGIAGPA